MKLLEGRTILVTRPGATADEFIERLRAAGAEVLHVPLVEIADPDSWEECDHAIMGLHTYDGILFTSRNAVTKFVGRTRLHGEKAFLLLAARAIYAVGEKTAEALEAEGLSITATPDISSAEDLAQSLSTEAVADRHFLFPKSDIARDVLPNVLRHHGAIVDEVVVYRTVAPQQADLDAVRHALLNGRIHVVTFFSPSSVRNFVQMLGHRCLENVPVAVLGPTTEAAAHSMGISVTLRPEAATSASFVESLIAFMVSRDTNPPPP
jgi:uroporphyrinogen-III synthase